MKLRGFFLRLGALVLLGLSHSALAQVIPDALFTLGTTWRDTQNRDWSYLSLQPSDPALLQSRKLAVYAKAGDAGSIQPYQRKAIIAVQTDPLVLATLIKRAESLGDSPAQLEERLDELFGELMPSLSLKLPDKLSAVIRGVLAQPEEHFGNLLMMGRTHPSVNLALGLSYAELIPNNAVITYELRDFDLAGNRDLAVLGRVTVQGGQPTLLPAPVALTQIQDVRATGHLNARFRWTVTAEHQRLALLNFGYHLYRLNRAFAEANNYHVQPPPALTLAQLALSQPVARRVNRLPILLPASADPNLAFVIDDNNAGDDGGVPFKNGEQFYYYVTALDLLGRDGAVSQPVLVTICDRVGPTAPKLPLVENDYQYANNVATQRLKVTWAAKASTPTVKITGYYVYRWNTPDEVQKFGGQPEVNRISPLIPHLPALTSYTFVDNGNDAPKPETAAGKTFWYTVRAVDDGACGPNVSPNSAPAFGVLRDRTGPDAPTGGIVINCCKPVMTAAGFEDVVATDLDPTDVVIDLVATRADRDVKWVDFYLFGSAPANRLGRFHFAPTQDRVVHRVRLNRSTAETGPAIAAFARSGTDRNTASAVVSLPLPALPSQRAVREARFQALLRCSPVRLETVVDASGGQGPADPDCTTHQPRPGVGDGGGGTPDNGGGVPTQGLDVVVDLKPTSREWRLYRRVDGGPLTLWKQGRQDAAEQNQVVVKDQDLPANASSICYYCQLLDEHGNASPVAQLGDCVDVAQPGPRPILAELEPGGTTNAPTVTIRWFCPTAGVERFELLLARDRGLPPMKLSDLLSENQNVPGNFLGFGNPQKPQNYDFGSYLTPQPGPGFGPGPQFSVTIPVVKSVKYFLQIRSVPKAAGERRYSNARSFKWLEAEVAGQQGPNVPWPARELPLVNGEAFVGSLQAVALASDVFDGVGIHIGTVPLAQTSVAVVDGKPITQLRGQANPLQYVFPHDPGNGAKETLLPVTLYRYQVVNDVFSKVSGDLIQVSPYMERIVTQTVNEAPLGLQTRVVDPFVRLSPPVSQPGVEPKLYLLDTQPVVREASYAYLVVRFQPDGEVRDVLPVAPIKIP